MRHHTSNSQFLIVRNLFAALALLTLGACQTGYSIPKSTVDTSAGLPADAEAVGLAIVETLKGKDPSETLRVRVASGASGLAMSKKPDYNNFTLRDHSLIHHGIREKIPDTVIAAGVLKLESSNMKRTSIIYDAEYNFTADDIVISSLTSATLFAVKPEAVMYLVPYNSINRSQDLAFISYDKLLTLVRSNQLSPATVPKGIRDYLVFVFLKDRVSPSSELTIKIASSPTDQWGYKDSASYMDFEGWRVGILQGSFDATNSGLYIKATFKPGSELESGGGQRLVGVFTAAGVPR